MDESVQRLQLLEETLRRNATWLRRFLTDSRRVQDKLHILVAARLRVLLCNGSDGPALLAYAREVGKASNLLAFAETYPASRHGHRTFPLRDLAWDLSDLSSDREPGYCLPMEDYLESVVGHWKVTPVKGGWKVEEYTPRDLIKWVAGKEAVHHALGEPEIRGVRRHIMPTSRPPEEAAEIREEALAEALFRLGEWSLHAIEYLLGEPRRPL